jgi:glucose/arabinose dehydrogenase
MRPRLALLLAISLGAAACTGGSEAGEPSRSAGPASPTASSSPSIGPSPTVQGSPGGPHLALFAHFEAARPLAMAYRTGDPALYVADQEGMVFALRDGVVDPSPVLNVSGEVSSGSEQGLLGLAFSPDGAYLYVDLTRLDGHTSVREYAFAGGRADAASEREVLFVQQPYPNHNGGDLHFGPDGYLYVTLGDGGGSGDPDKNAQNLLSMLGKILRIDPRPLGDATYVIPPTNPFAGHEGVEPSIWDFGLRNPWRISFDRQTGDLWIGDVGQSELEEIDFEPAGSGGGKNYGWNRLEGTESYVGEPPKDAVPPIYEYPHGGGVCTVTGGYVYRGAAIPSLQGTYLFADFCGGEVMALERSGNLASVSSLCLHAASISAFGEDQQGELYVLSLAGDIFKIEP